MLAQDGTAPVDVPSEVRRVDLPAPRNAPSLGSARAPVVIQEISDFQCPFCSRVQPTIARLLQEYEGRVRLVWRDFPLPFHPNASPAAQAAREVYRQRGDAKFWAYNELLFANQRDLTRETLERLAQQVGGINMAQFRQALDTERHEELGRMAPVLLGRRRDEMPWISPPEGSDSWAGFHTMLDRHESFQGVVYAVSPPDGDTRWFEIEGRRQAPGRVHGRRHLLEPGPPAPPGPPRRAVLVVLQQHLGG